MCHPNGDWTGAATVWPFFSFTIASANGLTRFAGEVQSSSPPWAREPWSSERSAAAFSKVSLRAVISEDAMTADWVELPYLLLREASHRILNEVKGVNRVLYDISTKPPASIEWE